MAAPRTNGTHADQFQKLSKKRAQDLDPEDEVVPYDEGSSQDSEDESVDAEAARAHYEKVGKGALRLKDQQPLGPRYVGASVSRKSALNGDADHDPFDEYSEDEASASEESAVSGSGDELENMRNIESDDDEDEFEADEDDGDGKPQKLGNEEDRETLRRLMKDDQKTVAASIAQATQIDVEKGRAVKRQRQSFDSFLNGRIRLQSGLVAVNSFSTVEQFSDEKVEEAFKGAEAAALKLWNELESFRERLSTERKDTKRKRFEASTVTDTSTIWSHMQSTEQLALSHRRTVLQKWSVKTQAVTTQPITSRLNNTAHQSTVLDVLADQLSNPTRLVNRTRMPRSCAPIQASKRVSEDETIYDDADFYGVLLKELLEQRNVDVASNVQLDQAAQQWRAAREAKTKKNVDTKASKGRKMRYTVHEKLQNFMAPEDRGSWGERQRDELFGSLLGRKLALREDGIGGEEDARMEDDDAEGAALRLFRS